MLLIYECCNEDDYTHPNEDFVRVAWSDTVPEVGELTSMGADRIWNVVQVQSFCPAEGNGVGTLYLIHVNRNDLALRPVSDWTSYRFNSEEALYVHLSDVGLPALEVGYTLWGKAPKIGEQLQNYEPTGHSTLMHKTPRPWKIDRIDDYRSEVNNAPYRKIHLCWCVPVELAVAA